MPVHGPSTVARQTDQQAMALTCRIGSRFATDIHTVLAREMPVHGPSTVARQTDQQAFLARQTSGFTPFGSDAPDQPAGHGIECRIRCRCATYMKLDNEMDA